MAPYEQRELQYSLGSPPQGQTLRPAPSRALAGRSALLPAIAARLLPTLTRSATAIAVGLAVEYAMRTLATRALQAVAAPLRRSVPAGTRTVVTEFVVIDRMSRRG